MCYITYHCYGSKIQLEPILPGEEDEADEEPQKTNRGPSSSSQV